MPVAAARRRAGVVRRCRSIDVAAMNKVNKTLRQWVRACLLGVSAGAAFCLAVSCSQTTAATAQERSIAVQGVRRTFLVYAPRPGAADKRLPIVMVLHGGRGDGRRVAALTGLGGYVDRWGFIAVFPDAVRAQWNDGRRTTQSAFDDVAFLRALIDEVAQKWHGDPARVFVAGISNGGMMALRMACDASDAVAGVGVVAANLPADLKGRCRPSRPVPVIMFNGTDDPIMPWDGGAVASSRILGGAGGEVVSALDTFDFWVRQDNCPRPQVATLTGTDVRRRSATNCQGGSQVVLYEIDGGGHGWPGGNDPQGPLARRIIGYVTNDISASSMLLNFFRQYGL